MWKKGKWTKSSLKSPSVVHRMSIHSHIHMPQWRLAGHFLMNLTQPVSSLAIETNHCLFDWLLKVVDLGRGAALYQKSRSLAVTMLWNPVKCSHPQSHKNRSHLREDMSCIHSFQRITMVNQHLLETCCQALFKKFFYWSIVDLQCCVSDVQQCESVINISAFSQILFPYSVKHSFKHFNCY